MDRSKSDSVAAGTGGRVGGQGDPTPTTCDGQPAAHSTSGPSERRWVRSVPVPRQGSTAWPDELGPKPKWAIDLASIDHANQCTQPRASETPRKRLGESLKWHGQLNLITASLDWEGLSKRAHQHPLTAGLPAEVRRDLAQDALTDLVDAAQRTQIERPVPFLDQVVRRRFIDRLRRGAARPPRISLDDHAHGLLSRRDWAEEDVRLRELLDAIPGKLLRWTRLMIRGLSDQEIAEEMEVASGTAAWYRHQLRRWMAGYLKEHF